MLQRPIDSGHAAADTGMGWFRKLCEAGQMAGAKQPSVYQGIEALLAQVEKWRRIHLHLAQQHARMGGAPGLSLPGVATRACAPRDPDANYNGNVRQQHTAHG